jgi:hypothetical protein
MEHPEKWVAGLGQSGNDPLDLRALLLGGACTWAGEQGAASLHALARAARQRPTANQPGRSSARHSPPPQPTPWRSRPTIQPPTWSSLNSPYLCPPTPPQVPQPDNPCVRLRGALCQADARAAEGGAPRGPWGSRGLDTRTGPATQCGAPPAVRAVPPMDLCRRQAMWLPPAGCQAASPWSRFACCTSLEPCSPEPLTNAPRSSRPIATILIQQPPSCAP